MIEDDQPWMIVQEKADVFHRPSTFVYCDRRQHLLIYNYPVHQRTSASTSSSTLSISDSSSTLSTRSLHTVDVQIVIYLERIQYIQRGSGGNTGTIGRSASDSNQFRQNGQHDSQGKQLEIYYCTDHPRSEYLYKSICFQLMKREDEFNKWVNALYAVIHEAKNLNESAKRTRWLLREYEKLKRSSGGLTLDSINGWLNSHIGLVGEKTNVEKIIKKNEIFRQSNEITDSVFKTVYNHFIDKQQENLIKNLMSDLIEDKLIFLEKFASRITNNDNSLIHNELDSIRKYFRLNSDQTNITFEQCMNYLWSDANSAFDPISHLKIIQDMDQPLNHYWISSSHNTYLAKTQIFNPASVHCYIQALLKGCRCIEIDVMDSRNSLEPEITHKNTRIKPIPLRDVLQAINDYAFITSEYPVIISIENHCSPEQRFKMSRMFKEIFGEYLLQSPISSNETCLPSPNQLKRKIILKDSKFNNTSPIISQTSVDIEEQQDIPSLDLEGRVQLHDFAKKRWFHYNYSIAENDLYLSKDDEANKGENSDDDSSDDDNESKEVSKNDELTQIWYHRIMSHQDAARLLLSNAGYEIGTFLIRKSLNKNCYCVSFLASNFDVKSIEIKEIKNSDGKHFYALSQKKFESIPDLVAHYQTYDFAQVIQNSTETILYRLGKSLPRTTCRQELERQPWYQPNLSREQAEELLSGIGEEMTFLIRESTNRARQDYTISVYTNGSIRHSHIYHDGSDLMLMSLTFTSLIELVNYFSRKPIFQKLTLQKPAKSYSDFINERRQYKSQGIDITTYRQLNHNISLKVDTLRILKTDMNKDDYTYQIQFCIYEEDKKSLEGYLFKFNTLKDWEKFQTRICSKSSPSTTRKDDENLNNTNTMGINNIKLINHSTIQDQTQMYLTEFHKLIIYCQTVKLKELNINKSQDLLNKIGSYKDMISLNFVKAATFCSNIQSMILFNQKHFTRIYPDFSRRSWNSFNFEPILYWLTGCQMVALNFQMPDRPMHINAGRFAANGGCGYILMPNYIRLFDPTMPSIDTTSMFLKLRVVAVRHLRTNQAKSISKVQVKTTIFNKQKPAENQICSTIINGPCGIWDSKQMSKHHDQFQTYNRLQSYESDVDLLYFEVWTDNQEFCGQSAIPLSSLRAGIRSVQLYDKFNERLDMSTLLIDIHFKTV